MELKISLFKRKLPKYLLITSLMIMIIVFVIIVILMIIYIVSVSYAITGAHGIHRSVNDIYTGSYWNWYLIKEDEEVIDWEINQ